MSKIKSIEFPQSKEKEIEELETGEIYLATFSKGDNTQRLIVVGQKECIVITDEGELPAFSREWCKENYQQLKKVTDRVRIIVD